MPRFVDRVVIHAQAGNGGRGCASVRREKFKPLGGPDGGNGGRGGSIVLVVDPQVHTLLDFHFHPHVDAPSGKQGAGNNRDGANGDDLELRVPDGTVILDEDGRLLADLVGDGTRFEAAAGGRGGLGNAALASRARKAPGFALLGEKGQARDFTLELKTVADVGLIGFPSAGKSSLVSVISAAKPKIADYPFTTLAPNLGVVSAGEHTFTVADVPGLIPGASEGRGLGLDFLRHIERCAVLVHVVDCATLEPGRDPISDIDAVEAELAAYTPTLQGDTTLGDLAERPRAVVLNKIDVPEARELADFVRDEVAQRYGWPVFEVSTVSRDGLRPLTFALWDMVSAYQQSLPPVAPRRPVIKPIPVDESGFTVSANGDGGFVVRGIRPERWVSQTDFTNDEAVGYLGDRLARLGVEDELLKLGAKPGCAVTIGDMTFDWEPQTLAGVDVTMSGRGTDIRLEQTDRVGAPERKIARRERRRPGDEE